MNSTAVTQDSRCGVQWLKQLDAAGRGALLTPLLSRFNHDLRTPLNTILGWTHLLQKGGLDPVRLKHVAEVIARNSRDETQLLEEFVDDGRTILNVLSLQLTRVRIDQAIGEATERIASMLTLHGVSIEPKLNGGEVYVNGDERRLARLAYRLMVSVTRRAREGSTIALESEVQHDVYALSLSGSAYEPDWSEAALLDLRISTLLAALHHGELDVGADATRPCIRLRLPKL
jgi:K+-sensing histidine kinase KdpD